MLLLKLARWKPACLYHADVLMSGIFYQGFFIARSHLLLPSLTKAANPNIINNKEKINVSIDENKRSLESLM